MIVIATAEPAQCRGSAGGRVSVSMGSFALGRVVGAEG
jgi:hypothetical protein